MLWLVIGLVFGAGCLGGLVNAVLAGELQLPRLDEEARLYRPGWLGNILVGGSAALVFWGLYGPMASAIIIGPGQGAGTDALMRVSELFGALLSGIGGSRVLTAELDKRLLQKENNALDETKRLLAGAVAQLDSESTK
jgi:hypothetical protein